MSAARALNDRTPWTPSMETPPDTPSAVLTEADWRVIAGALSAVRSKVGRPFRDERRTVEAVIWRARHAARWREIPESFGPWWRAAQLFYRWEKTGLWARLRTSLRESGREDLAALFASEPEEGESGTP